MTDDKGNPIDWENELQRNLRGFQKLLNLHLLTPGACQQLSVEATKIIKFIFGPKTDPCCEIDEMALAFFGFDLIQTINSVTRTVSFYFEGCDKPTDSKLLSDWINPDRLRKGDNLIQIMHRNAAEGDLKLHALPNHNAAGCDLKVIANIYFNFLTGISSNAPVYDAASAFARWANSFGDVFLAKEKREMLAKEVAMRYDQLCDALRDLSRYFVNYERYLYHRNQAAVNEKGLLPYDQVTPPPGFEKTRTGDGPFDYEFTRENINRRISEARRPQLIPSEEEREKRNGERREASIEAYRKSAEVLFAHNLFSDKVSAAANNCVWACEAITKATEEVAKGKARLTPFTDDQYELMVVALSRPTIVTYEKLSVDSLNGKQIPVMLVVDTCAQEARWVRKLQEAICGYCKAASELAQKVKSDSLGEWNRVLSVLSAGDRDKGDSPCKDRADAFDVRNVIHDASAYLYSDVAVSKAREESRYLGIITRGLDRIERIIDDKLALAEEHNYKSPLNEIFAPCFGDIQDVLKDGFTDACWKYGLVEGDPEEYRVDPVADKMKELCQLVHGKDTNTTQLFEVKADEFFRDIGYGNNLYGAVIDDGVPISFLELWDVVYRRAEETHDVKNWKPSSESKSAKRKRRSSNPASEAVTRFAISEENGVLVISDTKTSCEDYRVRRDGKAAEAIRQLIKDYETGTEQTRVPKVGWKGALQNRPKSRSDAARFKEEQIFMLPLYNGVKKTWPAGQYCGRWRLYTDEEMRMSEKQRIAKFKKDHPIGLS